MVTSIDGKQVEFVQNRTKNQFSRRSFPLVPVFKQRLLGLQKEQAGNHKMCGRLYNKNYLDHVCVGVMGNPIQPNYISSQFLVLLKQNGLRRIRFRDLRHTCASLLLAAGVPMKQIQLWLGHSTFSTTADIYVHLDYHSQAQTGNVMGSLLER